MMKIARRSRALCAAAGCLSICAFAQGGNLNPPPGPIMPTNRVTLDAKQISLPFVINQPGSYVLTSNFAATVNAVGFQIDADDVTLDLNGFVLDGAGVGGSGIFVVAGRNNVAVRNGSITNWQDIGFNAPGATNCRLLDVHVSSCTLGGFTINRGTLVTRCSAWNTGGFGFEGSESNTFVQCVSGSNSTGGFSTGLSSTLHGCITSDSAIAGIVADNGSVVVDCTVLRAPGTGIIVANGSVVRGCTVREAGDGISAPSEVLLEDNVLHIGTGSGIRITGTSCRAVNNHVTSFAVGLEILSVGGGSLVSNNLVTGNTTNYSFTAGNQLELLIAELPETILWPSRLVLAGSLQGVIAANGLTIQADDVTLDLNGFALVGVPGSLDGVNVPLGQRNVSVTGGTIRDWGGSGIEASAAEGCVVSDVRLISNGGNGASVGPGSRVSGCAVIDCGIGLLVRGGSLAEDCTVQRALGDGIVVDEMSSAWRCNVTSCNGNGFALFNGSRVESCTSVRNLLSGVFVDFFGLVDDCKIQENQLHGIECLELNVISNNRLLQNGLGAPGTFGILVGGTKNRVTGNDVKDSMININVPGSGNTIYDNSATGGAPDYNFAAGNDTGPVIGAAGALPNSNVTY